MNYNFDYPLKRKCKKIGYECTVYGEHSLVTIANFTQHILSSSLFGIDKIEIMYNFNIRQF